MLKNAVTLRQKQASVLSKALNLSIKYVGEKYAILKLAYFDWQMIIGGKIDGLTLMESEIVYRSL